MAKQRKAWMISPGKSPKPSVPDSIKVELAAKATDLIETVLKPKHVLPPQKDEQYNTITDIGAKWNRNYFYFISTYACPGPNALSPTFESKFARMEYLGDGKFAKTQDAFEFYKKGLNIAQRLADADTNNAQAQRDLIASYYKLGSVEERRLEYAAALSWYDKGIAVATRFNRPEFFADEMNLLSERIAVCRNAEKAIADLDFALKQPPAEVPGLLDIRLSFFAKKKDRKNLVATAEAYATLAEKDDKQTYNAACAWSLACGLAKDDDKLKEEYAGKAMGLLRKTPTGKGHFVDSPAKLAAHVKQDKDLDPLRQREDFKKFIAGP